MQFDMILGLLRHVLTFGGGWLVARGLLDESTMQEAVGAVITLAGVLASFINKRNAAVTLEKAVAAPAGKAE